MTHVGQINPNLRWVKFLPKRLQARLLGRNSLQAVLGNSAWQVTDKIVRMGVGVLVGLWVARYLGPHRFGQLNYAIALTSVFGAIANLGLDSVVIRELVRTPERKTILLGSTFVLKLVGSLLTLLTVIILVSVLRPGDKLALLLTVLSSSGFLFQSVSVDLYFQSKVQSKYIVLATSGAFLIIALVKVALMLLGAPLVAFAWAGLCELILAAAFILLAYGIQHQSIWQWKCSTSVMRDLLRDSWPLILTGISIMITMRVDQVLIGQLMNDKEVGLYSAAVRLSEIWYFIPVSIASSTFPALIESKRHSVEVFYRRLQHLYDLLVGIGIAVALVMTFLSGPAIKLLYGPAYAGSAPVLNILIWSGIPVAFGCAWSNWMVLENRTRTMFFFR